MESLVLTAKLVEDSPVTFLLYDPSSDQTMVVANYYLE